MRGPTASSGQRPWRSKYSRAASSSSRSRSPRDADAVEDVQQPDREPGADDAARRPRPGRRGRSRSRAGTPATTISRQPDAAGTSGRRPRRRHAAPASRVEARDELLGVGSLAGVAEPDGRGEQRADLRRRLAERGAVGERDRAVALGQPRAVGAEHERHVGVGAARGEPEPLAAARAGAASSRAGRRRGRPRRCPGRRRRRRPRGCRRTRRRCGARRSRRRRPSSCPRRRSVNVTRAASARTRSAGGRPLRLALGALGRGQLAAGAGVGALGQRAVRGRGGLADLGARAAARGRAARRVEPLERRRVERRARSDWRDDVAVPVEAERARGRRAGRPRARAATRPVSRSSTRSRKRAPCRAGEQPREQRGAQVAEVQGAGGGGGEAAVRPHAPDGSRQQPVDGSVDDAAVGRALAQRAGHRLRASCSVTLPIRFTPRAPTTFAVAVARVSS